MKNQRFIGALFVLMFSFSSLVSANNTLILDTLYDQGTKFISIESLSGRSASAFSVYKLMAKTDASHPKTHAFALLLDTATRQKVMQMVQQGDSLGADRLKLEYLSLQYEVGAEPSEWAAIKQNFRQAQSATPAQQTTPSKIAPVNLEAKKQLSSRQVKTLLSNAKSYLRSKQFFMPENRNVFHNIKRVLSDNPKNTKAINLYFSLLSKVENEVDNLLEDQKIAQAVSLTEQGLSVMPDHALLTRLNEKALGMQNFEIQIKALHDPNEYMPELKSSTRSALISNARTYLKRKQFFRPESSNAYNKYARVLRSDPDYSKALSGMFKLAEEVAEEVEELVEDGAFIQAQSLLSQGLEVVPNHIGWQSRLAELQALTELQQARIEYAQQTYSTTLSSRSQKALLSNVKSYLRSGNFFGNTTKNANAALHRVLAADPESDKVATQFEKLIEEVNETAIELAEDGELNKAASLLNQALASHAGHPSLTLMSGNLNSLMAIIQ